MVHTFAVYVEDRPGVLNRIASLFRRRAFNIASLTVGRTEEPGVSRMTVVVDTDDRGAGQIEAHLSKLVPVRSVRDITEAPSIARDLALIKVAASGDARIHVMQLVDVYRARIVDVSADSLVVETTGTEDKIDSLVEVLRPYGVLEMVRTGRVAMARGLSSKEKSWQRCITTTTPIWHASGGDASPSSDTDRRATLMPLTCTIPAWTCASAFRRRAAPGSARLRPASRSAASPRWRGGRTW